MATKDVTVRVQNLNGVWENIGSDRAEGVWPEGVNCVSDQWGSKSASFTLKRYEGIQWPDLRAFAPVDIEIGGKLKWSGRIKETPQETGEGFSVQCEGWQAHLDDDMVVSNYLHTDLGAFTNVLDQRDGLTIGSSGGIIPNAGPSIEGGAMTLAMPRQAIPAFGKVMAVLDLGPDEARWAKRVIIQYTCSNANANHQLVLGGGDDIAGHFSGFGAQDILTVAGNAGAGPTVNGGNFTNKKRYVWIRNQDAGAGHTNTVDEWFRISAIYIFTDTAYDSGTGVSQLKAHHVVNDHILRGCPFLNSDLTQIDTTGTWFSIPEFAPQGPRTPRQAWENVDVYEDRYKKIDVERRPIYKAKPTAPSISVGDWPGSVVNDASANDGSDIYNRVIGTGTDPWNAPLFITRHQGEANIASLEITPNTPTVANPNFAVNTTGWVATDSAITRDTAVFDVSPASGRWDNSGISDNVSTGDDLTYSLSGQTFRKGVTYVAALRLRTSSGAGQVRARLRGTEFSEALWNVTSAFQTFYVSWTPTYDQTNASFSLYSYGGGSGFNCFYYVSGLQIYESKPTIVDRWKFKRTQEVAVSHVITQTALTQILDKWLLSHVTPQWRGSITVTEGGVRDILTGVEYGPEDMLDRTGELIRDTQQVDPDTGAVGRDGRIVEVTYDHDSNSAQMTIDNTRTNFERLLERIGIYVNQLRT